MAKAPHDRNDSTVTSPPDAVEADRVALALARLLGRAHALESTSDRSLAGPATPDTPQEEAGHEG